MWRVLEIDSFGRRAEITCCWTWQVDFFRTRGRDGEILELGKSTCLGRRDDELLELGKSTCLRQEDEMTKSNISSSRLLTYHFIFSSQRSRLAEFQQLVILSSCPKQVHLASFNNSSSRLLVLNKSTCRVPITRHLVFSSQTSRLAEFQ